MNLHSNFIPYFQIECSMAIAGLLFMVSVGFNAAARSVIFQPVLSLDLLSLSLLLLDCIGEKMLQKVIFVVLEYIVSALINIFGCTCLQFSSEPV